MKGPSPSTKGGSRKRNWDRQQRKTVCTPWCNRSSGSQKDPPSSTEKHGGKPTQWSRIEFRGGKVSNYENTAHADDGVCGRAKATIVVVDYHGNRCCFITLLHTKGKAEDLLAIRLAELSNTCLNIVTRAQNAISLLAAGIVPKRYRATLKYTMMKVHITWTTGQKSLEGWYAADVDPSELSYRAPFWQRLPHCPPPDI